MQEEKPPSAGQAHKDHKEYVEGCWYCTQDEILGEPKELDFVAVPKGSKPFVRSDYE